MSLLIWLPLNGDIKNYGASEYKTTLVGSLSSVTGKIGPAYRFDTGSGTGNGISIDTNLIGKLGNNFSIACWVNPYGNHVHYNGTIFSSGNWNSYCWAFGLSQDNSKVDLFGNWYNQYISCSVPTNTWTHLACVNKNGTCYVYKNGEYVGSGSDAVLTSSDASNCCVGRETYAGGYFGFNGAIQDLRVYDHCLSPDEVKELSRALVAYYPLNSTNYSAPNLITTMSAGGRTTLIGKYGLDAEFTSNDTYGYFNVSPALSLNTYYTLSFDVTGLAEGSAWTWCLWNNANYAYAITRNGHHVFTFLPDSSKLPSGYSLERFLFDDAGRTSPTGTVSFRNFKIEEGTSESLWCPHANDASTTPSNALKAIDCSGYNRHGTTTASTAPRPALDSKRSTSSCWFNSSSKNITLDSSFLSTFTTGSVTWWAKVTSASNVLLVTGQSTGYYLAASEGWVGSFYNGNVSAASGYSIKYYIDGIEDNTPPGKDGKWHHYAVTGINMSSWTTMILNNYGNYASWNIADGNYSDLRFYNTVLSVDDIAKEYHNFAAIYNNGSLGAYDFVEA